MSSKENWYNASIFRPLCANWNLPVYRKLRNWLKPVSTVVDVGCGSGELLINCSSIINQGIGIDLSSRLIEQAERRTLSTGLNNLNFLQEDFLHWNPERKIHTFIFNFVLHEIDPAKRVMILDKAFSLGEKVLIADYTTPQPLNPTGFLNWLAETLAGKEHFRNFRHFNRTRWLDNYIKNNQITVLDSEFLYSGSYRLYKLEC